jgi:hypothetical protein
MFYNFAMAMLQSKLLASEDNLRYANHPSLFLLLDAAEYQLLHEHQLLFYEMKLGDLFHHFFLIRNFRKKHLKKLFKSF